MADLSTTRLNCVNIVSLLSVYKLYKLSQERKRTIKVERVRKKERDRANSKLNGMSIIEAIELV